MIYNVVLSSSVQGDSIIPLSFSPSIYTRTHIYIYISIHLLILFPYITQMILIIMPILDIAQDLSNTYLFDNIWKRSLRLCWDHPPLFFLLAALGLACGTWPHVQHGGSSSPTRDWTSGPALGAWSLSRWTPGDSLTPVLNSVRLHPVSPLSLDN